LYGIKGIQQCEPVERMVVGERYQYDGVFQHHLALPRGESHGMDGSDLTVLNRDTGPETQGRATN
jgi:hypothetical protein